MGRELNSAHRLPSHSLCLPGPARVRKVQLSRGHSEVAVAYDVVPIKH